MKFSLKEIPHWKIINGKIVESSAGEISNMLDDIKFVVKELEEENEQLLEENKILKSEHYKDEEIRRLAAEIDRLNHRYNIPREWIARGEKWFKKHQEPHIKCSDPYTKCGIYAPGHQYYSWMITPTSVDDFYEIRCECGETFDITKDCLEEIAKSELH